MASAKKVALVTGSNKGIGFEIARQLGRRGMTVLIGARDEKRGAEAAGKLRDEGIDAHHVRLDVSDAATVAPLAATIEARFGRLDVLVNNAGVLLDQNVPPSALDVEVLKKTFDVNVFGAFAVTRALLPLIRKSDAGRVVNLSSTLGSLALMSDASNPYSGFVGAAYQSSKTALNMLTVALAKELAGTRVLVNSVCPGWVKTDMGTDDAPLSVEQGADTPVWLATLPAGGPTGGYFNSRQPVAW
jgi:NAD(P)-dependent dehydrogenase (short-subunit alcohol dehydrogenase family)